MNAYRWWEIGAVTAYALMLIVVWLWPDNGDEEYDAGDCQAVGSVEYTLRDYHRKQSPVRETCPLTLDEEEAFEEITRGAGR